MKNELEEYKICCTEKQIKKAIALGAEVETRYVELNYVVGYDEYVDVSAEEMIGWIEARTGGEVFIEKIGVTTWTYDLYDNKRRCITNSIDSYPSRREATLAAIDRALDYLANIRSNGNE